jgi:hypothetical protein
VVKKVAKVRVSILAALANLNKMAKTGLYLSFVVPPKEPR